MAIPLNRPPWRRDRQPPKPFIINVTYTCLAAEVDLKIGGGGWASWEVVGAIRQLFDNWPESPGPSPPKRGLLPRELLAEVMKLVTTVAGQRVVNLDGAQDLTPDEERVVRALLAE